MTSVAVTGRADLTDAQWARLAPLLPRGKKAGRPPTWKKRQLIDGIRWRVRVDSTIMRAHQHAAGARRDSAGQAQPPGGNGESEPGDHGLGRSRGGWSTKLHLACEQGCGVLSLLVTPGQAGDSPQFTAVLDAISVPKLGGGRARMPPERVLADKAYPSRGNRDWSRRHGIKVTIPTPSDQAAHRRHRGRSGGRPPAFDTLVYRDRNAVERGINQLKHHRAVATRYDCDDEQVPPRVRG
ncbi:IS5 family transposase [Nocardia aobensis]|uniref:IS5 family transposase n=1 Tax=Nocardia aobensis TaxID=257277 RepID=A0ABW6PF27_9NOCA